MRLSLRAIAGVALASIASSAWSNSAVITPQPIDRHTLTFEVNVGQAHANSDFVVRGAGHAIELASDHTVLHLQRPRSAEGEAQPSSTLRTQLIGANGQAEGKPVGKLPSYSNYIGNADPKTWLQRVPHYQQVRFDEIYRGIDVAYYGNNRELEYDFIVEPGADPSQIRLKLSGAQGASLDAQGNLVIAVDQGTVTQRAPVAYQEKGGVRSPVSAAFKLDAKNQEVSFNLGPFDRHQTLVIDPVLSYATYFGGTGTEDPAGIAVDSAGGPIIAGYTSGNLTTSSGAYQRSRGDGEELGGTDAFITKLTPAGTGIAWSTYLGGAGLDEALAVAVDSSNNVIVAGITDGGFPLRSPAQSAIGGEVDAFVAKLSADGSSLVFSTYLGGAFSEFVAGVGVDSSSNVYVAGNVDDGFPVRNGYLMTTPGGGDGFVAKLSAAGSAVTWATYIGGPNYDFIEGLAVDASGKAVVTGTTDGGFPTQAAIQPNYAGGLNDGFLVKLNATGTAPEFATYFGGTKREQPADVTIDKDGNIVVVGWTDGSFPTTAPIQGTYGGAVDMFVYRINGTGTTRQFASYIGGSLQDRATSVTTDRNGAILVAGYTSGNFPLKAASQGAYGGGGSDGAITKILTASGFTKEWGTYLGGAGFDVINDIASYVPGTKAYIFVVGQTAGSFPTSQPVQATFGGEFDAFVARLEEDNLSPVINLAVSPLTVAQGTPATLTWSTSNATSCTASNAWSGTKATSGTENVTPSSPGTYTYTLTCSGTNGSVNTSVNLTVTEPPRDPTLAISATPNPVNLSAPSTITWSSSDATSCSASGAWTGTKALSGSQQVQHSAEGSYTYTLTCSGAGGKTVTRSVVLSVTRVLPTVTISASPASILVGDSSSLSWTTKDATSCAATGAWSGTKVLNGSQLVTPPAVGRYSYTLNCTGPGGTTTSTATVTVTEETASLNFTVSPTTVPVGTPATLGWGGAGLTGCTASGSWSGPKATNGSEVVSPSTAGTYNYTLTCTTAGEALTKTATLLVVNQQPDVDITIAPGVIKLGQSSTLQWSSTSATSCSASGAWSGSKGLSGSQVLTPQAIGTYTYTLSCTGAGGTGTGSATLIVNEPDKIPEVALSVTPTTIFRGQTSSLNWTANNATSCVASGAWSGNRQMLGEEVVSPQASGTYSYTLTCTGSGGTRAATAVLTVKAPPPKLEISASPSTVSLGESTLISWDSTDADSCVASGSWSGGKAADGAEAVSPSATGTMTYVLTCTGEGGSVTEQTSVQVLGPPPTLSITADPARIKLGSTTALRWTSTNTVACTATGGSWTGAKDLFGVEGAEPQSVGVFNYTMVCSSEDGRSVTRSAIVTVEEPDPVPTVMIAVAPGTVNVGSAATLTWSSQDAASCVASGAWTGTRGLSGSEPVTQASPGSYTYTLTCEGPGGTSSNSATLQVDALPEPKLIFAISPTSITRGQSSTLSWDSSDATQCEASGDWTGTKSVDGSETISPTTAGVKTYTLTCSSGGGTISRSVQLTVNSPAPTLTFNAAPASVTLGSSSTLTWSSTDATSCSASGEWTGAKSVTGSQSVTPSTSGSKVYTLTCDGPGGTVSRTATVAVSVPAPTVELAASPTAFLVGDSTTLTWSSTNATDCTASGEWSGTRPTAGSALSSPATTGVKSYTLTCTGAGGSASKTVTVSVSAPPPLVDLTVSPASIKQGQSATLSWTSSNTQSCTASGAWTGSKTLTGSEPTTPAAQGNFTYTLSCVGTDGSTISDSVSLAVNPPDPLPTASISASPASILVGGSSTLTWSSTNATSCTASGAWTGAKAVSGSQAVTPAAAGSYTYTLTCTGAGGNATASTTLTVTVPPAPTLTLSVNPTSVMLGANATVQWNSSNATSCTASGSWAGAKSLLGSESVTPAATGSYTYSMTCTGAGGSISRSAVLTVTPKAPTLTFNGTPISYTLGGSTTLTWSTTDADSCTASGEWTGAKAVSGTQSVTPTSTGAKSYTLTCTGPGGSISRTVGVTVTTPAPVVTISVAPNSIVRGSSATVNWSATDATSCTASGAWTGAKALSGSQGVTPTTSGTFLYTLSCTGTGGTSNSSATLTVTDPPAPTLSFSGSPLSYVIGGSTTLNWSATNATSCTASGEWTGAKAVSGSQAVTPATTGTKVYTLTCTGAGGSVTGNVSVTVAPHPLPTLNFTGSPTSYQIGGTTGLSWTSTNATSCTASNQWTGVKGVSGSESVTPTSAGSKVYTLTCTGPGGSISRDVTVTVTLPPPPVVTIAASPNSILPNGSSTVNWTTSGADSCTASGAWTGAKGLSGSQVFAPGVVGTYNYTLTCTNIGGSTTATATLTVNPYPVPTLNFTSNKSTVNGLGNYTLSWSATNATSCTASGNWTGARATTGTQNYSLQIIGLKTYTLSCTGLGGTITRTVTVNVTLL